ALILDLRKNGGGLLNEAVDLSGLFIPTGSILQVRDSQGRIENYRDENAKVAWDGPLIVLTSKLSASASEIFAGAMKDHRRALVVGDTTTHGKGSVQSIIELNRVFKELDIKSAIKVTIQKWYAPSGSSIQLKGVPADIIVPSVFSVLPVAESDLDHPLPWDSIPASLTKPNEGPWLKAPLSDNLINILKEASAKRQAEDVKLDAALDQEKKEGAEYTSKSKRQSRIREPLEDEDWPDYDIQLQEAIRIADDWSKLLADKTSASGAPAKTAELVR
ncbi:MAG: tail-specific protease, partial [Opitutae bacterium]|nr:tail-specific protease [Opitutae bacterium]